MKIRIYRFLPAIGVFALTWYFSDIPGLRSDFMPVLDFTLRKGAHMAIFMLQYITVFFAFLPKRFTQLSHSEWTLLHIKTTIITLILALFDEWHQAFVPGRTSVPMDIMYDSLGFLWAYCFLFIIWNGVKTKAKKRG